MEAGTCFYGRTRAILFLHNTNMRRLAEVMNNLSRSGTEFDVGIEDVARVKKLFDFLVEIQFTSGVGRVGDESLGAPFGVRTGK